MGARFMKHFRLVVLVPLHVVYEVTKFAVGTVAVAVLLLAVTAYYSFGLVWSELTRIARET